MQRCFFLVADLQYKLSLVLQAFLGSPFPNIPFSVQETNIINLTGLCW